MVRKWLGARGAAAVVGSVIALAVLVVGTLVGESSGAGSAGSQPAAPQPTTPSGVHTVRELTNLRTASSDTFLQSDGSRAVKIYSQPVNFRAPGGAWHPIEDRLARGADGSWHPVASPVAVSLPASLGAGPVEVGPTGRRLSFSLQGAGSAEGAAAGAQRTYANALRGVNASYAVSANSVRETLSLADSSAPTVYRYQLSLSSGLYASLLPGGGAVVRDSSGRVAYSLAAPSVSDSSPQHHGPMTRPVHYELSSDGLTLSLVLDKSWLAEPARVFPVKIDPDVYFGEEQDCTIASSGSASTSLCGGPLYVGTYEGSAERALLHFDLSCVPRNSDILRSRLALWFSEDTTSNPIEIEAHALTKAFTPQATWNTSDGTTAWAAPGGDFSSTLAGETDIRDSYKEWWVNWGFTPQVEQWVQEPSSNFGILLKAEDETAAGDDTFAQTENGSGLPQPNMEIVYEPRLGDDGGTDRLLVSQELGNGAVAGVNVANGNLNLSNPDVQYGEGEYETSMTRYYNSQDDELTGSSFGDGWRLGAGGDTLLYHSWWDGSYYFHEPGGMYTRYDRNWSGDGSPSPGDRAFNVPSNVNNTLVAHSDGTRTLTNNETGVEWKFDSSENGFPQQIVDPSGEGNTISLDYTESQLTHVADTHGHELSLSLQPSTHLVTKIENIGGEAWEYGYSASHQLTFYKDNAGHETKYAYGGTGHAVNQITDPAGTYVVSYDSGSRVTALRRIVNGTVSTPGNEDETTSFAYEAPKSPTCHPESDAGQTVVTRMPGASPPETYCYNAAGDMTGYAGPATEAEAEPEGEDEEQEEVADGTCYSNTEFSPEDCGAGDSLPENAEGEGGFAPLISSIPDLGRTRYGIADNNRIEGTEPFNYFSNGSFQQLHVVNVRRTIPWDLAWEGIHATSPSAVERYSELKNWIKGVKELAGKTGQPTVSLDVCSGSWINPLVPTETKPCSTAPGVAEYRAAVEAFLNDSVLGQVKYYTAWNEPNNRNRAGEPAAQRAGEYWRVLDSLCLPKKCQAAAGDFLDEFMPNVNKRHSAGGEYFYKYYHGMGHPRTASHWAWHAYTDGEAAGTVFHGKPGQWWKRFKAFRAAMNRVSKKPDIWLTEQGVVYSIGAKHLAAYASEDIARRIIHAYVAEGASQLTRQSHQIMRFFYYSTRGDTSHFDSGLLCPTGSTPNCKHATSRRSIYYVYRNKTPTS
jgi:hypothetical protein